MLIQFHILQNYAPGNLNRDNTGAPKNAYFGGYQRGRISSQCLKRSIRKSEIFEDSFKTQGMLGVRTQLLADLLNDKMKEIGVEDDVRKAIVARIPEFGRESGKKGEESDEDQTGAEAQDGEEAPAGATKQLIFIAPNELGPLADNLVAQCRAVGPAKFGDPKKIKIEDITKALKGVAPLSVDISLFGRMTTSAAFQDVEAAAQVAHAISTNVLNEEFDYYTAVDDLSGKSGASMIGDVEFNSSTYYRYLNVHWDGLVKNLGGNRQAAAQAVLALLQAAVTAHPGGKQNTFAAFNLPDLVLVEVSSKNVPVSYANAFIKPARAGRERSLMDDSVDKLADYMQRVSGAYSLDYARAHLALCPYDLPGSQVQPNLQSLQAWLEHQLEA